MNRVPPEARPGLYGQNKTGRARSPQRAELDQELVTSVAADVSPLTIYCAPRPRPATGSAVAPTTAGGTCTLPETSFACSALSTVVTIAAAITLYRVFYYPDSQPLLLDYSQEVMRQVAEIKDIERLRDVALYVVQADHARNQLANNTLQSSVLFSIILLAALTSFSTYTFFATWKAAKSPVTKPDR